MEQLKDDIVEALKENVQSIRQRVANEKPTNLLDKGSVNFFVEAQLDLANVIMELSGYYSHYNDLGSFNYNHSDINLYLKNKELLEDDAKMSAAKAEKLSKAHVIEQRALGRHYNDYASSIKEFIKNAEGLRQTINQIVSTINKNF